MEWFVGLSLAAQISLGVLSFLLLFSLAILGKVNLKLGKNVISFGRASKRSCGDCVLLLMSKSVTLNTKRAAIYSTILKEQMNLAEQKLIEIQNMLLASYRSILNKKSNGATSYEENKQYRLYQGILTSGLENIKSEIRRSFKENGFEDLSSAEFSSYVKSKFQTLLTIGISHANDLYPYEGMIVTIEDKTKSLETMRSKLESLCFEVYSNARDIKIEAKRELLELDQNFSKDLDLFLKDKL